MDRLACFSALWALAILIHQGSYGDWATDPVDLALTATAVLVFVRPGWLWALGALSILVVADIALELPWISNHWLFAGFLSATLLAAIMRPGRLASLARGRRLATPVDRENVYDAFAPWARLQLLVLYAAVVIHKLNVDFLDPEKSCAAVQSSALFGMLGLPESSHAVIFSAIYGTLAVEIAIPLCLIFRRTRWIGIALGIVFHGALGLNTLVAPFYNFSSILFASYSLFLPDDYPDLLRRSIPARVRLHAAWIAPATVAVAVGFGIASGFENASGAGVDVGASWPRDSATLRGIWLCYCAALLAAFAISGMRARPDGGALFGRNWAFAVFPMLLLVDASCPYLGLKTETSFAMFSNLRTEGDLGNHLLLRGLPRVAGYQDQLVQVIDSSDPGLKRVAKSPLRFVFLEFRAYTSRRPNASVRYRVGGRTHRVPRIADDPVLSRPLSILERKLLHFRLVDTSGRCRH